MPDENTQADSIRFYLTGAGSDGGTQTDHDAALGNYRSSTEISVLGVSRAAPIADIDVDYVSGNNGTGNGTLTATGSDALTWQAPGSGSAGSAVTITNGQTKILNDGDDDSKYIRVSRTSATALTGSETVVLAEVVGNAISLDVVTHAERESGDDEYRAIMLKNTSSGDIDNLKVFIATLGTQATTDSAQLSASGSGTITTTDSFSDWPDSGFAHVKESDGTTREIVYYSSRTGTSLTVPAAGRGQLGTSAAAGASDDTVDAVPGIRIAKEAPSAQPSGYIQTIANESTAPTAVTWDTGTTASTGLDIGTLTTGQIQGIWIHRVIVAGATAEASILNAISYQFDV